MNRPISILLAGLVLFQVHPLRAQFISTTSTNPGYSSSRDLEFDSHALLVAKGSYVGSTGIFLNAAGADGIGVRLLWYPAKAAFRAGRVDPTANPNDDPVTPYLTGQEWDEENVGVYSAAFGEDVAAIGNFSFAMGRFSVVSGDYGIAGGDACMAIGISSAAFGYMNKASGHAAMAFGYLNTALGDASLALGYTTIANGLSSSALNRFTTADGSYSTSMGIYTDAYACNSLVIGRYNAGSDLCSHGAGGDGTSRTTWYAADPVLEVGNGTSTDNKSDAFVVYKNGNTTTQGVATATGGFMTTAASVSSSDIPMFGH